MVIRFFLVTRVALEEILMKIKTNKTKSRFTAKIFAAVFVVVLLALVIPTSAHAQSSGGINLSFNPEVPRIGDNVTVILTATEGTTLPSQNYMTDIYLCKKGFFFDSCNRVTTGNDTLTLDFTLLTNEFDYVEAKIGHQSGEAFLTYKGQANLQVSAEAPAEPTLSINLSGTYFPYGQVGEKFELKLLGTDRVAETFVIDCPGGQLVYNPGSSEFECIYPPVPAGSPPVNYTVTVTASDSSGMIATGTYGLTISSDDTTGGLNPVAGAGKGSGGPIGAILYSILELITGILRQITYWIFTFFILPFITAAASIDVGTGSCAGGGSGFLGIVCDGWGAVRNVVNMFFILFLIIIGLATILKIEGYNFKSLLGKLILMALLVNFSLVIGQAILTVADVAQDQFIGGSGNEEQIQNMGKMLIRGEHFMDTNRIKDLFLATSNRGSADVIVSSLIELSITLIAFVIMGSIALALMIRLVALWILLILSPFAYLFMIMPATKSMASTWWNSFLKYAFFAPIVFFFMKLTMILIAAKENVLGGLTAADFGGTAANGLDVGKFIFNNLQHMVILGFLVGGLVAANKLSIVGANGAMGLAKKAGMLPFVGAGVVGGLAGGYALRKKTDYTTGLANKGPLGKLGFALANPKAMLGGYKERRDRVRGDTERAALRGGQEIVENVQSRGLWGAAKTLVGKGKNVGYIKTPFMEFEEREREDEVMKLMQKMSKEQFMEKAKTVENMTGVEGKRQRRGVVKAAASQGYLDDLLRVDHFASKYAKNDGTFYDEEVLNSFLHNYLKDDQQAMRFMDQDLETLGKATGHYEYLGHAKFDPKSGKYLRGMNAKKLTGPPRIRTYTGADGKQVTVERVAEDVDNMDNNHQAEYALSEFKKVGGRQRMGAAPHNFMGQRGEKDPKGNILFDEEGQVKNVKFGSENGQLTFGNRTMLSGIDSNAMRDFHFQQPRMLNWLVGAGAYVDEVTKELVVKSQDDLDRINALYLENAELMNREFGLITGYQGKNPIQGFKAKIKGEPSSTKSWGKVPKIDEGMDFVADEVIADNDIKQAQEQTNIKKIVNDLHSGKISGRSNLQVRVSTDAPSVANPTAVSNDIIDKYADQYMKNVKISIDVGEANFGSLSEKNIIKELKLGLNPKIQDKLKEYLINKGTIKNAGTEIKQLVVNEFTALFGSNPGIFVDKTDKTMDAATVSAEAGVIADKIIAELNR